jgi:hypothetical protein
MEIKIAILLAVALVIFTALYAAVLKILKGMRKFLLAREAGETLTKAAQKFAEWKRKNPKLSPKDSLEGRRLFKAWICAYEEFLFRNPDISEAERLGLIYGVLR